MGLRFDFVRAFAAAMAARGIAVDVNRAAADAVWTLPDGKRGTIRVLPRELAISFSEAVRRRGRYIWPDETYVGTLRATRDTLLDLVPAAVSIAVDDPMPAPPTLTDGCRIEVRSMRR